MKTCDTCGGLYATEAVEMIAGAQCKCRLPQARCSVATEKFTVIARYGIEVRADFAPDLRDVWALAEHELCHGADEVKIIVNRAKPQNEKLSDRR